VSTPLSRQTQSGSRGTRPDQPGASRGVDALGAGIDHRVRAPLPSTHQDPLNATHPTQTAGERSRWELRHFAALVLPFLIVTACEWDATRALVTANGSRLELPRGVEPVEFPAGVAEVHSEGQVHTLVVEIAETPAQRERGLMYRTEMPQNAGMLFAYPEEQEGGFWMYNTMIPLSIAYADSAGVIFQVTRMQPCGSQFASVCPTYPARQPFQYALEVNQGYFAARGIKPGDRITYRRD
jgi:uncharacterized protein